VATDLLLDSRESKRRKEEVKLIKVEEERKGEESRNLKLRPGYIYREANWEIRRAAEKAGVKVKAFKPKDRWTT
jgi:large subunit ribosomal protein L27